MNDKELKWEINIPLLNNRILMRQIFLIFLITYIIISILMSVIFITQGDLKQVPTILFIFLLVCLGLYILTILIMFIVFGNRMSLRFTVNNKGVLYEMIDKRGKNITNLSIFLGILFGKPTQTGSGLIAKSREKIFINYKDIKKIDTIDNDKVILLKNEWRTLMAIYCNDENYYEVKEYINNKIEELKKDSKEEKIKNPLPKYIILSIITILMSIPIFTLPYPFEVNLFVPILILFFTLVSIWLIRTLFFVTIGGSIYLIVFILLKLFEKRESVIFNISIYSLKGKLLSMLERDISD